MDKEQKEPFEETLLRHYNLQKAININLHQRLEHLEKSLRQHINDLEAHKL